MHNKKTLVYPQLPKAGLGNRLLVWARAILFAQINNIPVIEPNWDNFSLGPYLRGESDKRYYRQFFDNKIYLSKINYWLAILNRAQLHYNWEISQINPSNFSIKRKDHHLFIFNQLPHWSDLFRDLKNNQPLIKQKLFLTIKPDILKEIDKRSAPEIGVHIRRGDFKQLKAEDDFTKFGNARTPLEWFIVTIEAIRAIAGYNVPVTLFSDGYEQELSSILGLPQVKLAGRAPSICDLLTLSKSKLLIVSSGSTFSGWASYLGQCPTIWHPAHFHSGVFGDDIGHLVYEGGYDPCSMFTPSLLVKNIEARFHQ